MGNRTKISFENPDGHALSARVERPLDGHARAWALFAHCFTCSKDLRAARRIVDGLNRRGVAVLSFDFTGLGQSEGEFAETNFSTNIADLVAAARYMGEHHQAPALLVGHSLGGAAVLHAAHQLDSVRAVATIAAPFEPEHVARMFEESREEIERTGQATVELAGRSFTITRQLLEDLEGRRPEEIIGQLDRALLVLHAPRDESVSIDNATRIFTAARHPRSYISLDGADHLLSDPEDAAYAGEVIGSWAERYIDMEHGHDLDGQIQAQVVTRTGRETYHTDVMAGHHGLVADEPTSVGGQDHGPSPYDLLLAALGTCTSMTLRMYADRKGWPLEQALVHLDHERRHAEDCESCEDQGAKLDHIDRHVELLGDLDEAQRERLLEIADRCPVHRTLGSEIVVTTRPYQAPEDPGGSGS